MPVTLLITHWSSKRLEIEREVPYFPWESRGFDEINLDNPQRDFILGVGKAACEHLQIEADEGMQDAFVREIANWDNTPACAVASLRPYSGKTLKGEHGFYPVSLKVRDMQWCRLFCDLQNKESTEVVIVFRTLSALRWCGMATPSTGDVCQVAKIVAGASEAAQMDALERLEKAGWIYREVSLLHSHDLLIFPSTVGLHNHSTPSFFLERFAAMAVSDNFPCIRGERIAVLHHLGQMYWDMGQVEKCIEFESSILDVDPQNIRALCNRGFALA